MNAFKHISIKRQALLVRLPLFLLLIVCFSSCEKFVDVGSPRNQLLDSLVFKDFKTAETAVLQVYIDVRDNYSVTVGCSRDYPFYVDDMITYSVDPTYALFKFYNAMVTDKDESLLTRHWDAPYSAIYKANRVIVGMENPESMSADQSNQLKGEALFLRALLHWRLANTFGAVPYITSINYVESTNAEKLPKEKVFELVQKDVELAASLLPVNYPTADRVRVNKKVAEAFLAQIYLYTKQWEKAENMATEVISATGTYQLETDISKTFLKGSKETIWQFAESNTGTPTTEAVYYVLFVSPETNTGYGALTDDLLNSFEAGDKRRSNWVGQFSLGGKTWSYVNKYKERNTLASASTELSIAIRLSELYLIRAEARAERENFTGAQEDLDAIRSKANLGGTPAADKSSLRTAILKERRVEFFCEGSHRYFDLKRSGTITQVLGPKKQNWTDEDIDFPISEKQKLLNPNLN
ncbi:MAG: RagB/SusD family nutrient uptake outer membrane protein [Pseudobacter sp.]|uniref:RagB/SusD family nutrient uptake outer membrane protein n=1 Tax=Pseudobacter sp. TaxID=2045420 RepID=UPI003F811DE0